MTLRQRIRFYQQLAVLTRAGVPLRSSLERLRERIPGREMTVLSQRISAGESLGDAFAAAHFSPFESHLVIAGERSAQLEVVLQHLSDFWARQLEMYRAVTGQLYYPVLILGFSLLVGALLDSLATSWYVALIHLIENVAVYGAIGFIAYTIIRVSWTSDAAQRFWLAVPMIGSTLSSAYAYRWITALKLEHAAGIPMPDAVADAWRASGFAGREALAQEGQRALFEGNELAPLVHRWKQLPRDWVDFIETGEIAGALETAFNNLESEAARAWDEAQKRMTVWAPKIIYFIILLVIAAQVVSLGKQVLAPLTDANKAVEDALK